MNKSKNKPYIVLKNGPEFIGKFKNKQEKQKYIQTCLQIWGCIPCDIQWAMNTFIYQITIK